MRSTVAYLRWRALLSCAIAASLMMTGLPAVANPTNAAIEQKRDEAVAAQAKLTQMSDALEIQIEEYNAISEALDATREDIRKTRSDLEAASSDLLVAQQKLAQRAANIYKDGKTGFVEILLGTTSFEDFVSRIDLLTRINRSDADLVARVKETKARVESIEAALVMREAEQVALRSDAEARAISIEDKIAKQEEYVASLESEVAKLIKEEEARQARLAAERAAEAARLASNNTGGRAATAEGDLPGGHPEVVSIALKYLGVPYVWGGASPSGFDCSGLCQYVYKQIGITLPRTSKSQYNAGSHIDADRLDLLRSGDLVFFGTGGDPGRVHHVGIYVGSGNFIHAPSTGDVVKVSSLTDRIATKGDYVGASRF